MGAGKPGLQRPRNDRRFPPPGVKDVASYGCHPFRRGVARVGGARRWRVPSTTPTLLSQRAKPRRRGPGCAREPALEASWHGLPKSYGLKPRAAPASRVHPLARRVVAPHGGEEVEGATPCFSALVRHRAGGGGARQNSPPPLPFSGGRSLHSDPWREGHPALPRLGRTNRPVRFPHRRRDLRSLRGKSVQEAFRGVLVCQGVRKSSLPGKARGFKGGRTPSNASPSLLAPSRPRSWEREKGAAGMMEGPGESSPRSGGSKGPEPLASPNVLHWVGWLPGTTRCGAGPAVPASHGHRALLRPAALGSRRPGSRPSHP